jgi:cytochrome c-type biogenesis protein
MEVSVLLAFVAGVLSFLSPCVLPLVPPYLCYLAGTTLDEMAASESTARPARWRVLLTAALFVLGFSTVFITLGATASFLGQLIFQTRVGFFGLVTPSIPLLTVLGWVAGVAIIVMGLHFLGLFRIALLYREARFQTTGGASSWGAFVMGLAFAFGWTPCIGPILAAILAVAASEQTVTRGIGLLAIYSAGLGVPFLVSALAIGPFLAASKRFRRHLPMVEKAMGVLLIVTGVLFLTGAITTVSFWMLENLPNLYQFEERLMRGGSGA